MREGTPTGKKPPVCVVPPPVERSDSRGGEVFYVEDLAGKKKGVGLEN